MARSRAHGAPRAAPTPAAAGTRHAAAEPTMGYSASNAVRGEAHRPGQAAALLAPSSARSSTADRRSGARGGSAPPRRPASAGAPPSHPPARTSAVSNRIRAGSACEPPPSFFSFSSPRRTLLVPRRAPGPSARFSVCAGGPALYIVAPPNARAGAWPVGARKCTDLIYWILCRPWSCLAAAECIR
jgi:hypothetical protein